MKSIGRLSYNNTFYTLLGVGLLWKVKGVSAIIVCFIYFWAQEFYEKWRTSQLQSWCLHTSGYRNYMNMMDGSAVIALFNTSGDGTSMKSEGCLSHNRTFCTLAGLGIL